MHPALPIAGQVLTDHTGNLIKALEHHADLKHGRQLAQMLQTVILKTNETITERQIEAILQLTQQNYAALNKTLDHYMAEQREFNRQYRATNDPLLRAEIDSHIANIDNQIKTVHRGMEVLHNFSARMIHVCGQAGLTFVKDLSLPYTMPRIGEGS